MTTAAFYARRRAALDRAAARYGCTVTVTTAEPAVSGQAGPPKLTAAPAAAYGDSHQARTFTLEIDLPTETFGTLRPNVDRFTIEDFPDLAFLCLASAPTADGYSHVLARSLHYSGAGKVTRQ